MNMQIRFNYDIDDYELFTGEKWTKVYVQEDVDAMQAEIESLKKSCFEFQTASIDLAKKNAFLEDWKKTWSPYIKEVHGINTTILRKNGA